MQQAWWKRALSHFTDVHIESVESEINPELYVCLSKGRYQLCVKNAIYSFEDKYDNYWDTFSAIDVQQWQGKEILILGFGLGSIPIILEKMGISANFTGVEYDEEVSYLFHKYSASGIKSPLQMVTADANIYMKLNQRKFDLIAMDVFVEDEIPRLFKRKEFMQYLKDALTDDGLLIWNHLYHDKKDRDLADEFFASRFKEVFEKGDFFQTSGNKMLLNKKIVPSRLK